MTRSREEIKLPSRINTHDDSSTDSSSEDEDSDSTSTSTRVTDVSMTMQARIYVVQANPSILMELSPQFLI